MQITHAYHLLIRIWATFNIQPVQRADSLPNGAKRLSSCLLIQLNKAVGRRNNEDRDL